MKKFKAAAVIASPVFDGTIDGYGTTDKVCSIIREAAENGAKLVVFPEAFLPFYPWWVYMAVNNVKQGELYRMLYNNSFSADSPQIEKIANTSKETGTVIALGMNEKEGGTLYNSQLFIDQGKILGVHRKLMPTGGERTLWGRGDGSGVNVYDTSVGRVGGLICYEHSMVLARYALYAMDEQIHVSMFPGANFKSQPRDRNKTIDAIIRGVAFEGQCFVVNATTVLSKAECDWYLELDPSNKGILEPGGGIAAIVNPACNYIGGPLEHEEGIVYAEIDLDAILGAKHMVDALGHYGRPDVFTLIFNNKKQNAVILADQMEKSGLLTPGVVRAIKLMKEKAGTIADEQMVAAIEELGRLL